jgi:hypothetical protein
MLNIFVIQRPQWKKKHPVKDAAAHQDPASLFDEDLDDMYQDADIPNAGRPEAGTTASEFDGAPNELEAEDSEEDKGEAIEVDESDEKPKSRKSTKKVRSRNSLLYPSHLKEYYRLLAVCQSVTWHVSQK